MGQLDNLCNANKSESGNVFMGQQIIWPAFKLTHSPIFTPDSSVCHEKLPVSWS